MKEVFKYSISITILGFIYFYLTSLIFPFSLKIFMSSNTIINNKSTYEFYFDRGDGYNEKNVIYNTISTKNNTFTANVILNDPIHIKHIRFDPPQNISDHITITKMQLYFLFITYDIQLKELYNSKNMYYYNNITNVNLLPNNSIEFTISGNDPQMQIFKHFHRIFRLQLILFSLFISILSILLYKKFIKKILYKLFKNSNIQRLFSLAIVLFLLSIFIIKSAVTLISLFYYKRNLSFNDIIFTYAPDLLILSVTALIGTLLIFLLKLFSTKNINTPLLFVYHGNKILLSVLLLVVTTILFISSLFYLLSGYIYLEWGAFIEPQHIKELVNHHAIDEFNNLFFRSKTYIFLFFIGFILFLTSKLYRYLINLTYTNKKTFLVFLFIILFLSSLAYFPLNNIYHYKPSTQSPLLLMAKKTEAYTRSVNRDLLYNLNENQFNPLENHLTIPKEYKNILASAKDMNIIFYIMESVRKHNLSPYGYKKNTMPALNKLVNKGAYIFHNSYVNQPRSCKTMSSLLMGTYPDPRLEAIVWKYKKIKDNQKNFISKLEKNGYHFYFGTMQEDEGGDHFGDIFRKLTNKITIEDPIQLLKHNHKKRNRLDERLLTDSFLQWSKQQSSKFTAFLWTKSAHMPYISPIKKWKENNDEDKYNNCLLNIDKGLDNLITGLKRQKKLKNTLLIIMGDHGEALGNKLDWGHGNYLYEHSLNIPFIIYNPKITNIRNDYYQRFQIKDIPVTILYMLGVDTKLNQSINIFSKNINDNIYLSNVHQDYKLGLIYSNYKFVYRPKFDLYYLYDLKKDPHEELNIIGTKSELEIERLKESTLLWYKYQIKYLNTHIYNKSN